MGKTLGEQAKAFRLAKVWTTAQMGAAVGGVSRQSIENLEASGNRLPKYIGDLAHLMGVTVDEMLAEAGMFAAPAPAIERWPFERVALSRVRALSSADRAYVEGRLEEALRTCEQRATPAPSRTPKPSRDGVLHIPMPKGSAPSKKNVRR